MEEKVTSYIMTTNKAIRFFKKEIAAILKIGETVKSDLNRYKSFVPLTFALKKDGIKDRYWEQLSSDIKFEVKPTKNFTFHNMINLNLVKHMGTCEYIDEKASKEYTIELELAKMKGKWDGIEFFLVYFKKSETYTATGFD